MKQHKKFFGRATKREINAYGTLYALFEFTIYDKKHKKGMIQRYEGNDTNHNVRANINVMKRNAFLDAKYTMLYINGGYPQYDVKLMDYGIVYRENTTNKTFKTGRKKDYGVYVEDLDKEQRITYKAQEKKRYKNKIYTYEDNIREIEKKNTIKNKKVKSTHHYKKKQKVKLEDLQRRTLTKTEKQKINSKTRK